MPRVLAVSEHAARAVETDLRRLYGLPMEIIRENATVVRPVADALLARWHLGPAGFLEIVERAKTPGKEPRHG